MAPPPTAPGAAAGGPKAKKCRDPAGAPVAGGGTEGGGHVLPGSVDELWAMGGAAAQAGDDKKAAHLLTLAIDVAAKGMPRSREGVATDADLEEWCRKSEGKLAQLLSDRSRVYLRLGDTAAAVEDADTCSRADPAFEKGHVRLAVAYEAAGAALEIQLEACERGLAACPASSPLLTRVWRLRKAVAEQKASAAPPPGAAGARADADAGAEAAAVAATRRAADDPSDPRRAAAAGDWGGLLATGAHGVTRDVAEAERYLRLGAEGGDVAAQRRLGLLLLELRRPAEAAEALSGAAAAGDEEAADVLARLADEARARHAEMRAKLEELAADGDERAAAMLRELPEA